MHRLPHRFHGALLGIVAVEGRLLPAVSPAVLLGIDAGASRPPHGARLDGLLAALEALRGSPRTAAPKTPPPPPPAPLPVAVAPPAATPTPTAHPAPAPAPAAPAATTC